MENVPDLIGHDRAEEGGGATSKMVNIRAREVQFIDGIGRELAWRIQGNGPYRHRPAKPRIIQEELKRVRGVGRERAGEIYRKLIKNGG